MNVSYSISYWQGRPQFIFKRLGINKSWFISLIIVGVMTFFTPDLSYFLNESYEFGEELMKALSIFMGGYVTLLYTPIFAIVEAFMYISEYGPEMQARFGDGIQFVLFRTFGIVLHCAWAACHYFGYRYARRYKSRTVRIVFRCMVFLTIYQFHVIHNNEGAGWLAQTVFKLG